MTHPAAEKWDKLARVPYSISSDSRCCSPCFFILGFLGGSCELWLRRIWPIKVVFAPRRNAKQTFWKWKDFLLIPFHAHLLSSEVTMGPEEAAWGRQMDCGRRGGGSTPLILISSVSLGRNTSGWDPMGGTRSLHVPFPNFCSLLTVSPSVRPLQESNFRWIQYEFFPRFFMPFMKTRSAFNAFFMADSSFFFFFPFLLFKPLQTFMSFSRRFFRSVKLALISKRCLLKRRLTQSGRCHLRLGATRSTLGGVTCACLGRGYVSVQKHKATGDDGELRRALF